MDNNRDLLMKEIMSADFTAIELGLYLNTHPWDQRAIMLFNSSVLRSRMLKDKYERMYGPINQQSPNYCNTWKWIESPWPWEK
ncbi:MAG TPA: spore coat protein CotJB [Pseudobacteroides sp.]|nr:spore coat protein CotJB [Pseudobacteroides sp.]